MQQISSEHTGSSAGWQDIQIQIMPDIWYPVILTSIAYLDKFNSVLEQLYGTNYVQESRYHCIINKIHFILFNKIHFILK